MAAAVSQPLKDPEFYTPLFKVSTYLRQPLYLAGSVSDEPEIYSQGDSISGTSSITLSLSDSSSISGSSRRSAGGFSRRADRFGTLYALQLLCDIETKSLLYQRTKCPSRFFQSETSVLVSMLQPDKSTQSRRTRSLFPEAYGYISTGSLPKSLTKQSTLLQNGTKLSDYFEKLAKVHQLTSLSSQINSDITALPTHKYIPHQLAVLHGTLNEEFSDPSSSFYTYKQLIEGRFDSLKQRLRENNNQLIQNHEDWLMELTSDLVEYTDTIPPEVNDRIADVIQISSTL